MQISTVRPSILIAIALLASTLSGQAFNLDVNNGATPPGAYGAAALQPGFWNGYAPVAPGNNAMALTDIHGNATAAEIRCNQPTGGAGLLVDQCGSSGITPPHMELMCDYVQGIPNRTFKVLNLLPGDYGVWTYTWRPGGAAVVYASPSSGMAFGSFVSNFLPWTGLVLNQTHATHRVTIAPGAKLKVQLLWPTPQEDEPVAWNGVQIVPVNIGAMSPPQTVLNSTGQVGVLTAHGYPDQDQLWVQASQLPPNAEVVLYYATGGDPDPQSCPRTGVMYLSGDGTIGSLPAAVASPSGAIALPVSQNELLINTPPGMVVHFQLSYRDNDDDVSCGPGGAWHWTNGVAVSF